jgi:8-oxo-dGTP pyrophosphatase MutT (NUDIX family)
MKKPWQKISSRVVHENPWWRVRADKVISPDGRPGIYYLAQMHKFVSILALSADQKSIYLIRQWRYPINRNSWETSQGMIEPGETPLRAAKRELREETGFTASRWRRLGFNYLANGFCDQAFYVFLAAGLEPGQRQLEGTEQDMIVKKFSLKQAKELVRKGIILDSPTIVSFYYLNQYLKK